jgi:transposase
MADRFKIVDRDTEYLFPPSVQDWLPSNHLARFVVELVDEIDLEKLNASYKSCGSLAFHPSMMVALLFYGYATGVFSSRKLERATRWPSVTLQRTLIPITTRLPRFDVAS